MPTAPEQVAPTGLRRLTAKEYDDTLRDLLLDDSQAGGSVLPEDGRTPFDNDYTEKDPSQTLIEGAELLADDAAARLLANPTKRDIVVGCIPASPADEACFRSFVTAFGRRAYRRPLTEAEIEELVALLPQAQDHGGFYDAVEAAVRVFVQAPSFLYRVERGTPVDGEPGLNKLDGYEIATRLSYLLWGSTPSDELLDAAEVGELDDAAGVAAAAETMLLDPRAIARIDRFHSMWLGYEVLPHAPEVAAAMRRESLALLTRVVFEERAPWRDLLLSEETFIDATLAEIYGLPAPAGPGPAWVSYGDSGRQGLLSQGSFLSLGAKFGDTSPTQRGLQVVRRLFCENPPPPPPELGVNVDEPPGDPETDCKVDRYKAIHLEPPGCAACHQLFDPVGFGLENYDAMGRYRSTEPDKPECLIDGQGEVKGVAFSGPKELADAMLELPSRDHCIAEQVYRFTVGRSAVGDLDAPAVDALAASMDGGEFRFDELLMTLVSSDGFRFRRQEEI